MDNKKLIVFAIVFFVVLGIILFKNGSGTTGLVTGMFCKDVTEYRDVTKYRSERYEYTEEYKNCDSSRDCSCIHKSWLGLGSCDTCRCIGTKQVPYQDKEAYTVKKCLWD